MNDEEITFDLKIWEDWVKANPNLVNIEPAMFWSTVGKEFKETDFGWVELKGDDDVVQ